MKRHFEPDLDYHPGSRTWEDFWRGSTSASFSSPTWSHDGLDPDDAPLILRNTGMWDLYVLDWEAPWEPPP